MVIDFYDNVVDALSFYTLTLKIEHVWGCGGLDFMEKVKGDDRDVEDLEEDVSNSKILRNIFSQTSIHRCVYSNSHFHSNNVQISYQD
jgi:hypothetical protein